MTIARGGVITGIVRDIGGRPVPGVNVRVLKLGYNAVTGERTLGAPSTGSVGLTDDRGEYRAYGLPPGGYLVAVVPSRPVGARQRRHPAADGGRGAAGVTGGSRRRLYRHGQAGPADTPPPSRARELRTDLSSRRHRHRGGGDDRPRHERGARRASTSRFSSCRRATISGTINSTAGALPPSLSVRLVRAGPQTEMVAGAGLRGPVGATACRRHLRVHRRCARRVHGQSDHRSGRRPRRAAAQHADAVGGG